MTRKEPSWRRYFTFWRPSVDRDVDAEIRFHFEERVADLVAHGHSEAEARSQAEQEFGDRQTYRNRMREIGQRVQARRSRAEWVDVLRGDVRLAWRGMKRAPTVSAMVVVTLALGIGANGAIFSMLDRIFLRPPPGVHRPSEIRRLYGTYDAPPPMPDFVRASFNYPEIADMRAAIGQSVDLVGYSIPSKLPMGTDDNVPELNVSEVTGDYFGLLGVRPALGRFFSPDELEVHSPHFVVVLSHRFWTRQLGGDVTIIGKTIPLGRRPYTVIGIAQAGFSGIDIDAVEVWRPAGARGGTGTPWYQSRNSSNLNVIWRSKSGESEGQVLHAATNGLHSAIDASLSTRTTLSAGAIIFALGPADRQTEPAIAVRLAGVTLMVLLIAIANVANLLLTRAIERRREMAIRVALGVSRARLAALLVTESAVLALIAGTAALFVATWGAALIRHLLLPDVRWANSPLDFRLAGFTFGVALAAGALAGVVPFLRTGKLDLSNAMRGGAREGGAHRSKVRAGLIIAQAALSVVLLAGAALFLRSLNAVHNLDLGFDVAGIVSALPGSGRRVIPPAERAAALPIIRDRVARIPGVRAAALASISPMFGFSADRIYIPGRDSMPQTESGPPTFTAVSADYFKAVGVPIIAGRSFTADDRDGSALVMIVTETMAKFIWGKREAIGQCARISRPDAPCTTVVGVVKDVRRDRVIEGPMLQYFLPLPQAPAWGRVPSALVVGTTAENVNALRQQIHTVIGAELPGSHSDIKTVAERLEPQYRPWRIGATLFAAFGLLALLVAAIGVYSAISFAVTQRSHELGVRMALGAQRSEIGRLVVSSGMKVVGSGVVLGVMIALALSRLIESLLYGTDARDPAVLVIVSAVLLGVTIISAALPAWRASRLDPVGALRAE